MTRLISAAALALALTLPNAAYASERPKDCYGIAWCGCFARLKLVSSDPGKKFNLAQNWKFWGRPTKPVEGAIVVWPHHVGKIVKLTGENRAVVISGNDSGRVRKRERSIATAIAFRTE